jgi:hypothetical protein
MYEFLVSGDIGDGGGSTAVTDARQGGEARGPAGGDDEVNLIDAEETGGVGNDWDFEAAQRVALVMDVAGDRGEGPGRLIDGAAFAGGERAVERAEAGEPDRCGWWSRGPQDYRG